MTSIFREQKGLLITVLFLYFNHYEGLHRLSFSIFKSTLCYKLDPNTALNLTCPKYPVLALEFNAVTELF